MEEIFCLGWRHYILLRSTHISLFWFYRRSVPLMNFCGRSSLAVWIWWSDGELMDRLDNRGRGVNLFRQWHIENRAKPLIPPISYSVMWKTAASPLKICYFHKEHRVKPKKVSKGIKTLLLRVKFLKNSSRVWKVDKTFGKRGNFQITLKCLETVFKKIQILKTFRRLTLSFLVHLKI